MNVIARLEFELAYYNVTIHHVRHKASGDKGDHTFPKVNVIAPLEFEFANFSATIQFFSHYAN